MTAVAVLGVVADAVGIFQFVAEKFASKDDGSHAVVRVAAALDGGSDHLTNGGGGINSIRLYNENEEDIGDIGKRKIGNGEFQDFKIKQSSSQQAAYAAISATNDAICVPYVTMTWADGAKYGWIGDWGEYIFAQACIHETEADLSRQGMRPELVLWERICKCCPILSLSILNVSQHNTS